MTQTGICPTVFETSAIGKLKRSSSAKQLKSFLGSGHRITKMVPNLAKLFNSFCELLRNKAQFVWTENHKTNFNKKITAVSLIVKNSHYNPSLDTRVMCDASRERHGAALEQQKPYGWETIAYASRFLNDAEKHYSIN